MKRIIISLMILAIGCIAYPQAPFGFNYQAIVRDTDGTLKTNESVSIQIRILQSTIDGPSVYLETHNTQTNEFGLVNLVIGEGNTSDILELIDWSNGPYFIETSVDEILMGISPLQSVPYALYAASGNEGPQGPAGDPATDDQQLSLSGKNLTISGGNTVDLSPAIGSGASESGWESNGDTTYSLKNVGIGTANPNRSTLAVQGINPNPESPLFEVRREDGFPVFAVHNDGVKVYVDDEAKGVRGGFAVGGYSRKSKGITQDYMTVTPDSVRVYFDETVSKGIRGGFAVGGYSRKAKGNSEYFNISGDQDAEIISGINRVVWYPQRNAFLVGNVLVESADSVGENSLAVGFQSKAVGNFSEAFGHRSISRGDYSTAIGDQAIAHALNSVSIGTHSRADKTSSFALGTGAIAFGVNSYAIGSSGVDSAGFPTGNTMSVGEQSFALGMGSRAEGFGSFSIGTMVQSIGDYSVAMGYNTQATGSNSTSLGKETIAQGKTSTAMGHRTTASEYASTAMGAYTTASGNASTAMGLHSQAVGHGSTAMGYHTSAGISATSMGHSTSASGISSTAMGAYSRATGAGSTAMGDNAHAEGSQSTAMGSQTYARGNASTASGKGTIAAAYCSVAMGQYNSYVTGNSGSWVDSDPLLIIGNGTGNSNRYSAMLIKKNGETYFPFVYNDDVGSLMRDLYIDNTGKIGYVSSSQLNKKSIRTMEGISWIYDLNPVNFTYISDQAGRKQYGLIAEEVEEVNPLFVSYSNEGEPETVSYSQLITPIIKALQDQDKLIKELQSRIEELEGE